MFGAKNIINISYFSCAPHAIVATASVIPTKTFSSGKHCPSTQGKSFVYCMNVVSIIDKRRSYSIEYCLRKRHNSVFKLIENYL